MRIVDRNTDEEMSVAVVLSGCGVFDGSEIHESSAACVALARAKKTPVFFAPDKVGQVFLRTSHNLESSKSWVSLINEIGSLPQREPPER